MRILNILTLCVALGGCGGLLQQTATPSRFGDQFVGQNVTSLVTQLGKPISRKKMDNDQMSYVWDLEAPSDVPDDRRTDTGDAGLYGDGHTPGYMTDDPRLCKMTVVVSREGTVTEVTTEEHNGTGAPAITLGFNRSICAQRLGTRSPS